MWKAYLDSVQTPTFPTDEMSADIRFEDIENGKSLTKNYHLVAGNFKSIQDIKDLVLGELDKLNKFDAMKSLVTNFIGKEIK
jgi:hypothetical protein